MFRFDTLFPLCLVWAITTASVRGQCTSQELFTLMAADAAAMDGFGRRVAVFSDTAVVGASSDNNAGGNRAGSAYVFVQSGDVWTGQAKLSASDAAAGDYFGDSIALAGDTVVIGAPWDTHASAVNAGSAYVFVRTGGVWTEQAKLIASDASASDNFGYSVALSGDTVLIGANGDAGSGAHTGSAYVFVRSSGIWTQEAKLTASDAAADDWFGTSVSLSGDTALIGSYLNDDACPGNVNCNSGSAYVFVRSGTVWTQQAKLTASDAATFDVFGYSVAISGDTAVVGAFRDDHAGGIDAGSAYVFTRIAGEWIEQSKLIASDAAPSDFLGQVSVAGDIALIGAYGDDQLGESNAGSAYFFTRSGGVWAEPAFDSPNWSSP